jgi:hypothetical protein
MKKFLYFIFITLILSSCQHEVTQLEIKRDKLRLQEVELRQQAQNAKDSAVLFRNQLMIKHAQLTREYVQLRERLEKCKSNKQ